MSSMSTEMHQSQRMLPKKLYLYNTEYQVEMINGKKKEYDFKNVFITDLPPDDPEGTPDIWIPIRVYKATEAEDMLLAKVLTESIENYHKANINKVYAKMKKKYGPTLKKLSD